MCLDKNNKLCIYLYLTQNGFFLIYYVPENNNFFRVQKSICVILFLLLFYILSVFTKRQHYKTVNRILFDKNKIYKTPG